MICLTVLELTLLPSSVHVPVYQYQFFFLDTIDYLHIPPDGYAYGRSLLYSDVYDRQRRRRLSDVLSGRN